MQIILPTIALVRIINDEKNILFCKLVFLCNNNLSYALTIIRVENIVRI